GGSGGNTGGAGGGGSICNPGEICDPGDTCFDGNPMCGQVCCDSDMAFVCAAPNNCVPCPGSLDYCGVYNNMSSMPVNCNGTQADCCKDTDTDDHNCGGCGADCVIAGKVCVAGHCQ
ncbi:hypothetical protein KC725_05365, partial [Candidatus Peregrinibacteria bacterium]|nr:hypothetical protein [Candidatus Peregrinibacteria bacterium]